MECEEDAVFSDIPGIKSFPEVIWNLLKPSGYFEGPSPYGFD